MFTVKTGENYVKGTWKMFGWWAL